jgi:hypothetical protein
MKNTLSVVNAGERGKIGKHVKVLEISVENRRLS